MIDLYYWTTPNGHKVTIFLEETGTPYKLIPINIGKGEQFKADFLAVSPNNRIPALVDHDAAAAAASRSRCSNPAPCWSISPRRPENSCRREPAPRADAMQWLFWQMGGLGPMSGQNNHFSNYAVDKMPYAMDRYRNEVNRLYGVMNTRLADRPFLAGEYSIADMASYPWVVPHERQHQKIADFPHLKRWLDTIAARPAMVKAYELVQKVNPGHGGIRTAEERAILFGQTAASMAAAAAKAKTG